MARKQWSTTLNEDKLKQFNEICEQYGINKNTVLEALMDFFSEGRCKIIIDMNGCKIKYETESE